MSEITISEVSSTSVEEIAASSAASMRTLIVTSFAENSRATWLRPHFSSIKNISYLTLCDRQDTFRPQAVSSFLRKYGEDSICDEHNAIQRLQNEAKYALSSGNPELPLVVDVSCMSRRQMGYVMAAIRDIAAVIIPIRLQLIYCLAKFTRPRKIRISTIDVLHRCIQPSPAGQHLRGFP